MHFKEAKTLLSSKDSMNLYRGCQHGCIYCDSRSECYGMDHGFEDIEVKSNSAELLEKELKKRRTKCMIGMGSMTDPYLPLESDICSTRRALEIIRKYGFGATLITKSDLVLRDLALLKDINSSARCVIQMTVTTYDDALCRIVEPNVCVSSRRFEVLGELNNSGIPTVVWLCPILPFINDTEENVRNIVSGCASVGVKGIICFGMGLTLRKGNREYFYEQLDRNFPGMKERYISAFGDSYGISSPRNNELMELFHRLCDEYGIMHDNDRIFEYLREFDNGPKQTTLF